MSVQTMTSYTTMTIGDLCVSLYNVRTNARAIDDASIASMAESLLSCGQLYPLVVHPMTGGKGKKKKWGVLAGGRRLRAFNLLVTQGRLPASHPIEVIVRNIADEGELVDLSLAENLVRVGLREYEVYAATARAHAGGRSYREIADTNGQTVQTIRQWARMGSLEKSVFAALAEGAISPSHAEAFAATDDHDLQKHVFDLFMQRPDRTLPNAPSIIRRMMKFGDSELAKLLRFVNEKAYADAGGRYELDLFADQAEERGRVVDEGLLMQLVEAKLERTRALLRQQVSNAHPGRELRFEANPPRNPEYVGTAHDLEINPGIGCVDPADAERFRFLDDEMTELVKRAQAVTDDSDLDQAAKDAAIAAIYVEYEPLQAEYLHLDRRRAIHLPAGDTFCTLEIEQDGELVHRFWWASRKAKRDAEKAANRADAPGKPVSTGPIARPEAAAAMRDMMPRPEKGGSAIDNSYGYSERQKADAAIKDQHGLNAEGVQIMRALRREVLRCGLLDNADGGGTWGRDYATWCLLRFELAGGYGWQIGARRLDHGYESTGTGWAAVTPHIKRSLAGMRWDKETAALRAHPSIGRDSDPVEAFRAFINESEPWRNHAAAVLAGLMLERSLAAPGYQVPLHDLLAAGIGLKDADIRAYCEPTEELIDILPRAQRLALAKPHVDAMGFSSWSKLKAAELTAPVTRALRKARAWVHPLMQFDPPPSRPVQTQEAAE